MRPLVSAFALMEVLVSSVIAAAVFIFALTAIDYNNRQAEIYRLYSSVVNSSIGFNDFFIAQARRGPSTANFAATISASSSASCQSFMQLHNGSLARALCRDLSRRMDAARRASPSSLSVSYRSFPMLNQTPRVVTLSNTLPSINQTRSSSLVIPWGN